MEDTADVRRRLWVSLALVGAIALAAGLMVIDTMPVGVFHDDATYVILARALASGQGYRDLNLPGSPAATHFPPLFPALLALISLVSPAFPKNLVAFKIANAVLFAIGAALTVRLASRRCLDSAWATGLGITAAVSVPMLALSGMISSEPLFYAATIAMLWWLEDIVDAPASVKRVLLVGFGIGICAMIRTHGAVLLPAAIIALGTRRRWRDAGLLAAATIAALIPWEVWSAVNANLLPEPLKGSYGSYAGWWLHGLSTMGPRMIVATIVKTIPESATLFGALFTPIQGFGTHTLSVIALVSLAVCGAAVAWREARVTLLFIIGYLVIVMIWPFPPDRFLWAIWPLLLLLVFAGARRAILRLSHQIGKKDGVNIAFAAAFAWVTLGYMEYEVRAVKGAWWGSIARQNAQWISPTTAWISAHTDSADVVAAEDEGAVYLYTGRKAVPVIALTPDQFLHDTSAPENANGGLVPILDAYPVTAVFVRSRKTVDAADYLVAGPKPRLERGVDFPGGVVYRVRPK